MAWPQHRKIICQCQPEFIFQKFIQQHILLRQNSFYSGYYFFPFKNIFGKMLYRFCYKSRWHRDNDAIAFLYHLFCTCRKMNKACVKISRAEILRIVAAAFKVADIRIASQPPIDIVQIICKYFCQCSAPASASYYPKIHVTLLLIYRYEIDMAAM